MGHKVEYQIKAIPFSEVQIDDSFWTPRLETNRTVTVPYDFQKCEETGRIDNFARAGGLMDGEHEGIFYNDSDVFKVIEGAAYSLTLHPDPELERYLDDLIAKIAAAQEDDGYLYTARTIDPGRVTAEREGLSRWSNLRVNHELYNVGHLYEAAVAYQQATGKGSLLEVALKNANLIDRIFGPNKKRDVPGHQEIEIGLVKLYQATGEKKYLELANFFLDERGQTHGRVLYELYDQAGYMQDHQPVIDQREAVGHAVRAGYMYCGMADVAALSGNANYVNAIDGIWEDVVSKKLYITGGIGALHRGEAFGSAYELPNDTAYAETCAAIANIMWNQRMFLLHGEAKYLDVLERTLYNGFLSGVSFSGDLFFYTNPLASDGTFKFNRKEAATRRPWFNTSCCPTNVVRFIPSIPGYIYGRQGDDVYINLFIGGEGRLTLAETELSISQSTNYPWDGRVEIKLEPEKPAEFGLNIRIPGWAQNQPVPGDLYRYIDEPAGIVTLTVNGDPVPMKLSHGFAQIWRRWQAGDRLELNLPMPVRRVVSHGAVAANRGRVALERGPLLYCAEQIDNSEPICQMLLPDEALLRAEHRPDLLNGVTIIRAETPSLVCIPYYAWSHRGEGQMAVWVERGGEATRHQG